jgi:hypothetical protein
MKFFFRSLKTEFILIHKHSVRASQERHYVTATKPNRLMLFRETVAVYCKNHTEHTNTLCGQNAEFCNIYKSSSYLTGNTLRLRYKPNGLMLFKETVPVHCENHTEHTNTLCRQNAELQLR